MAATAAVAACERDTASRACRRATVARCRTIFSRRWVIRPRAAARRARLAAAAALRAFARAWAAVRRACRARLLACCSGAEAPDGVSATGPAGAPPGCCAGAAGLDGLGGLGLG